MTVLHFISLERFANFFDKDGSRRSQISIKLEIKLRKFVQYDIIVREILQIFTFSTRSKALELAFSFLGHKSDKEAVVCSIDPR